ncbi:hypothetical protein FB107DRAFT_252595 [Schizophyllum commune]
MSTLFTIAPRLFVIFEPGKPRRADDFGKWYTRLTVPHGLSLHTASLVYPMASRPDPTDILARRVFALEPAPPPRSSTTSGYVAKRGNAVGTTSPHVFASTDLAAMRAHAAQRDLAPDDHAHLEMSVAAGELGKSRLTHTLSSGRGNSLRTAPRQDEQGMDMRRQQCLRAAVWRIACGRRELSENATLARCFQASGARTDLVDISDALLPKPGIAGAERLSRAFDDVVAPAATAARRRVLPREVIKEDEQTRHDLICSKRRMRFFCVPINHETTSVRRCLLSTRFVFVACSFCGTHACAYDAPYPSQGARMPQPSHTRRLLTLSALECNPIPVLFAQGSVLGAPDIYDVSRLFSDAAPCSATRGCRNQAKMRPPARFRGRGVRNEVGDPIA